MALGFVPGVGQAYGAATTAATFADPDSSNLERGLAGASVLPMGKLLGAMKRQIVIGRKGMRRLMKWERDELPKWKGDYEHWKGDGSPAKIKKGSMAEINDYPSSANVYDGPDPAPLNEMLLNHRDLYAAYPELKDMPVHFDPDLGKGGGSYSRGADPIIRLSKGMDPEEKRSVLLHEVQHAIQHNEEMAAKGSNPTRAGGLYPYYKEPGEAMSRTVQARENWSSGERASVSFPEHMKAEQRRIDYAAQHAPAADEQALHQSLYYTYADRLREPMIMKKYLERYKKSGPDPSRIDNLWSVPGYAEYQNSKLKDVKF